MGRPDLREPRNAELSAEIGSNMEKPTRIPQNHPAGPRFLDVRGQFQGGGRTVFKLFDWGLLEGYCGLRLHQISNRSEPGRNFVLSTPEVKYIPVRKGHDQYQVLLSQRQSPTTAEKSTSARGEAAH